MKIFRKQTLVTGGLAVSVVAAAAYGLITTLNIQSSNAAFQKSGQSHAEVQVGNLEFTMKKLLNIDVSKALDTGFDSTGVQVDTTAIGNTTEAGTLLSYTESFENVAPGWKTAYGFEVENTGSLKAFLDMYLGTAHLAATDATVTWDEQDPRSRIEYTIYSGSELTNNMEVVEKGTLDDTDYGNFQYPGKIAGTNEELEATGDGVTAGKMYYIIKLEFTENDAGWTGNDKGDNIYEKSAFKVNLAVGTSGPYGNSFEFETSAKTPSQGGSEEP